ncbi:MAG: C40 family peptidase [Proteobacteria bacterium]|nr:C40 family peptidase [Pseudomonadota bacterium]MCP4917469.1 C40 family peptidase [Pseudomonadota bacterium]
MALAADVNDAALEHARTHLDTPWAWNGQATTKNPGLGCMSLVYRSYSHATGTPRSRYPVNPSELLASERLGTAVAAIPVGIPVEGLEPGDVVFFLTTTEIPDDPMYSADGVDYWPWHMGLWAGDGQVLHAEPGGVVRTQAVEEIAWDVLLATRPVAACAGCTPTPN